ncbi:ArdC-like ssDNA-binding domain-containing protein [Treponema pedis]|uniref:ArdC-like ssDNA-binding domain-containing protein n=1 Tax=Treponema pedis TaxID=409322 RepID=UPI00041646BB|nr:ArdC-like ssDNA-binding domain-containing protein [Treponema pedis]
MEKENVFSNVEKNAEEIKCKSIAMRAWSLIKTNDSFKDWYDKGFSDCMQEAVKNIDSGACEFKNGSFFEISRFISKDGRTHNVNVEKDELIKWFGNWIVEAYNVMDTTAKISNSARVPVEYVTTQKFKQLLENDNLPFLPNKNGYCNVHAVKNTKSGYEFEGANQLIAKMYLHERGLDNDNILTFSQANDLKSPVKAGEKGFSLAFFDAKKNANTIARYFAEKQTKHLDILPYQETKEPSSKSTFKQMSSDPLDYLTNYLDCVKQNRAFTADPEVAAAFKQNFAKELDKSPFRIYELGAQANKQLWCQTEKGIDWLKTEKGQAWLKTDVGKRWLDSDRAANYRVASKEAAVSVSQKKTGMHKKKHMEIER